MKVPALIGSTLVSAAILLSALLAGRTSTRGVAAATDPPGGAGPQLGPRQPEKLASLSDRPRGSRASAERGDPGLRAGQPQSTGTTGERMGADPTAVPAPLPPSLTLVEKTRSWQSEFLDRTTQPLRKVSLLGLLRYGKTTDGTDPRTEEVVAEALWLLDQPLESERREDVVSALRGLTDELILLKAISLLRNDPDLQVRGDAAGLLGQLNDPRATTALKWSLKNDTAQRVRDDCAEALE